MKTALGIVAMLAVMAVICGPAMADDSAQIADLQTRIASLETAQMAPAGAGDCESLTSLNKKGQVKLGGEVALDIIVYGKNRTSDTADIRNTTFQDTWAKLNMRVDAGTDTYLFVQLHLRNGLFPDELVEQLKFVWENVKGSKWTVSLGKDEILFGSHKRMLVLDPYVYGGTSSSILAFSPNVEPDVSTWAGVSNGQNDYGDGDALLDYSFSRQPNLISGPFWPGIIREKYSIQGKYQFTDKVAVSGSIFQNAAGSVLGYNWFDTANLVRDGRDYRARDNIFQSYALQLTAKNLVEGLNLQASYVNLHDEVYASDGPWQIDELYGVNPDDLPDRLWDALEDNGVTDDFPEGLATVDPNTRALSVGGDYTMDKLTIYGEYMYGWDLNHLDGLSGHVAQLGAAYAITDKVSLIGEVGYVYLVNKCYKTFDEIDGYSTFKFHESLMSASLGASYTCDNGIQFLLQYMHEWYKNNLDEWPGNTANVVAFRTAWNF